MIKNLKAWWNSEEANRKIEFSFNWRAILERMKGSHQLSQSDKNKLRMEKIINKKNEILANEPAHRVKEDLRAGDPVVFYRKENPWIHYLGRVEVNVWGTELIIQPQYIDDQSPLRNTWGVPPVFSLSDEQISFRKISEKDFFHIQLKGRV
jgi:hypothetical protein